MACSWIGVGVEKPAAAIPAATWGWKAKALKSFIF
jgi:hypothetical protein